MPTLTQVAVEVGTEHNSRDSSMRGKSARRVMLRKAVRREAARVVRKMRIQKTRMETRRMRAMEEATIIIVRRIGIITLILQSTTLGLGTTTDQEEVITIHLQLQLEQ